MWIEPQLNSTDKGNVLTEYNGVVNVAICVCHEIPYHTIPCCGILIHSYLCILN